MASIYGRLKLKSGDLFFPKTYANLVYMKGNISQTVQSRIEDIISGLQKVGSSENSDKSTLTDTIKLENSNPVKLVIKEKGYTPAKGNYTNAIVFIKQ